MHRRRPWTPPLAGLLAALFLLGTAASSQPATEIADLERTLADARRADRPDLEARALVALAEAYARMGDVVGEIGGYRRAADVLRRLDDPATTASVLIELGRAYAASGVTGRALAALDEAAILARRNHLAEIEGKALKAQLTALETSSDYRRQVEIAQRLLVVARDLDDSELEAWASERLENARTIVDMFDDPEMAGIFPEGDGLEDVLGDVDLGLQSFGLKELAQAFMNRGDVAGALELCEESLDVARHTGNVALEASTLETLASFHMAIGGTAAAREAYRRMAELAENQDDPRRLRARSQILDATLMVLDGKVADAEPILRNGLSTALELADPELQGLAHNGLGVAAITRGDLRGAIEAFRRHIQKMPSAPALETLAWLHASLGETDAALEMADASLGIVSGTERGFGRAGAHTTRGFVLFQAGRWAEAEASLRQAVAEYEGLLEGLAHAEQLAISGRDFYSVPYELLQRALLRQGKHGEALEVAERARARQFALALARRPGGGTGSSSPPTLAEIRALAQRSETTLIVYSLLYDPGQLLLARRMGGEQAEHEETLVIWVVTPEGDVRVGEVDLTTIGGRTGDGSLADLVTRSRPVVVASGRGVAPELVGVDVEKALAELAAVILDPVLLSDGARLAFVPQGPLFLVPFAALPGPDGQPLVTRFTVSTAPSVGVLLALEGREMAGDWSGDEVLVVGNPKMPPALGLGPLSQAKREAESIARRFDAEALVGEAASQSAVVAAMPDRRLLHLATHGRLEHQDGDAPSSGLLGALVFASRHGDGLLTADEVAGMKLAADLVVLSACDTGQGRLTGDGVLGLSRAFLTAGAGAVVVSLWQVDDKSTRYLMERFYDALAETHDEAEALRRAMLETRKKHPAPGLWAGFTSIGGLRRSGT